MSTQPLNNGGLLEYSGEHLFYEVQMLLGVEAFLGRFERGAVHNAMVEAFAIHLRNLIDFLYPKKSPWDTDVIAADFFDDAAARERTRPALSKPLKRGRKASRHGGRSPDHRADSRSQ